MSLKKFIFRQVAAPLLLRAGWFRKQLDSSPFPNVILNYHGVLDREPVRLNNRHLPASQFEQDLRYLKEHFDIVTLQSIFDDPAKPGSRRPRVALTFDDGYENNYNFALPLLKKFQVPATFYIVSGCLENPDFMLWADVLDVLFHYYRPEQFEVMGDVFHRQPGGGYTSDNGTLWQHIKAMGEKRNAWIEALTSQYPGFSDKLNQHRPQWKMMSAEQVRACHDSGWVEIGSHTHQHYNLGQIPGELARSELSISKRLLEDVIQAEVCGIGYPDGNYSVLVKDLAEEVGYKQQTAVDFRLDGDFADSRIRRRFSYSNSTTHSSNFVRLQKDWKSYAF